MSADRSKWPLPVRLGLWGLSTRSAAWVFVWLSVALAIGAVAYGFVNPLGFLGGVFAFAGLWYYLSIRWVDRHSTW